MRVETPTEFELRMFQEKLNRDFEEMVRQDDNRWHVMLAYTLVFLIGCVAGAVLVWVGLQLW